MYNEQIENLINLALADGELTEKEKQVLFKKAEAAGIDLDEFEMVLDARLYEKNNTSEKVPVSAPKSDKYGDVKKCPACGAMITAFTSVCVECGYEYRDIEANKCVQLLSSKLEEVVSFCEDKSYEHMIGRGYGDEESARKDDITSKQKEIIKNFPVPNTRDDIMELLHFISPKTKVGFGSDKNVTAWRGKFSEVINRAKIAFKTDSKILSEIEEFEKQQKSSIFLIAVSKFNELSRKLKIIVIVAIFCAIYFGSTGIYSYVSDNLKSTDKEIKTESNQPIKTNEELKQQLIELKSQLTAEEEKIKELKKFHVGRSRKVKGQEVADQTLLIERLKNQINDLENKIQK